MRPSFLLLLVVACGGPAEKGPRDRTPSGTLTGTPAGTLVTPPDPYAPVFGSELLVDHPFDIAQVGNIRRAPGLGWGPGTELLLADAGEGALSWIGCELGDCVVEPISLPPDLVPVRTAVADMDGDGATDIVLSTIGELGPSNEALASLWVLYRDGDQFTPVLLSGSWPRTVCAEPADFDNDGDLDLTVCQYGHVTVGSMGWLEQLDGSWVHHPLIESPGTIHAYPADLDNDGDLDIVSGVAQKAERVLVSWNDGSGGFTSQTLFAAGIENFGLSGIEVVDLDQDGDLDVLLTNGDTLDSDLPPNVDPNEHYGVHFLENLGGGAFAAHHIHGSWGAYAIKAADMDGDDDLDLVLANYINRRTVSGWPEPASIQILENDGQQGFDTVHDIEGGAPQALTLELVDVDGDDDLDILTGSLNTDSDQTAETLVLQRNLTGE